MHETTPATASAPARDSKADLEIQALDALLKQRRAELGIVPAAENKPIKGTLQAAIDKMLKIDPVAESQRERELAEMEAARKRREMTERYRELCNAVGGEFRLEDYRLETSQQRKAVEEIREFIATLPERMKDGNGLVLSGPVGTGKDHLAFCVCRAAILSIGLSVKWVHCQDWFGLLRDNMDKGASEDHAIGSLVHPDILVLSDPLPPFGELTQFQSSMLYRVCAARAYRRRPMIVTLNVADDAEADRRLGVPTWDRMTDKAWMFKCEWPSYRKPAKRIGF